MKIPARPRVAHLKSQHAPHWSHHTGLDADHKLWLSSGRAAITLALQHAGLDQGSEVLIPAFLCPSMLDPIKYLGLKPVFYALHSNLTPDVAYMRKVVTSKAKAVLITRYFGFGESSNELTAFCEQNGLTTIEDRAHAFFGPPDDTIDYIAYSIPKFFPVFEGGLLASNRNELGALRTKPPELTFQVKTLIWPLEYAAEFGNADGYQKIGHLIRNAKRAVRSRSKPRAGGTVGPAAANGGSGLEAHWLDKRISVASKAVVLHSKLDVMANNRRRNWQRLVAGLNDIPGFDPICEDLPDDVAPYAAAFFVAQPETMHSQLKLHGVPLYRWDTYEVHTDDPSLKETASYARRVFQIPVHQAIDETEIDWIIEKFRDASEHAGQ